MPEPPSLWPLAPGWWILISIAVLSLVGLSMIYYRMRHTDAPPAEAIPEAQILIDPLEQLRQTALEEFHQLEHPLAGAPASQWLQQINALLKRISRIRYPNANPHTLSGRAWLAFLDSRCPAAGLTRWMILVEGAYRTECHLTQQSIDGLSQAICTWIQKHA